MIDTLKTIGISAVVVIVALLLTGNFTSNPGVGGTYEITKQFFSAGIDVTGTTDVDALNASGTVQFGASAASSSVSFGRACWNITTTTGSTTFVSFVGNGSNVRLATSSTSCN
jgi:hypothetical protein